MKRTVSLLATILPFAINSLAQQEPCRSTVVGDQHIEQIHSRIYDRDVTLRIWLPPDYSDPVNSQIKYPVLYMLDGQNAFDECTAFQGEHELRIDETVTKLISERRISAIVVVGIDSSSRRSYEYSPYPDPVADPRAPAPIGTEMPSFIVGEVLPFVTSRYRITDDPAHTGIGGTSLGASAALYVALNRPDLVRLALIESPNLVLGNGRLLRDTSSIVRAPDRIAIGVGSNEVNFPKIEDYLGPLGLTEHETDAGTVKMVETLVSNLKGAFFKQPEIALTVQPGANHSSQFREERIPADIEFLYRDAAVR